MSEQHALSWIVVVTIAQLITLAAAIVGMRRKPPLAEELYRDFATRQEMQQLRAEFLKTSGEIFDVMRQLRNDMQSASVSFAGQVSRLEGILSRCPGPETCAEVRRPH